LPDHSRVIVLGIDGVPHSLLTRLIEAGELPNFARLAQQAPLRQMDSVHPTVSSAAWTSYATGKQPGKHGIYGFVDRKAGTYEITIPLSTSVASKTIWEVLGAAGKRVFGMNVPVTYPPRRVNGILIGGFLCPTVDKVANPPEVARYLRSIGYQVDSDPMLARKSRDLMLPNLHETLDRRMEAMFHFLQAEPWDYFHTHVMATDRLHHFLIADYEAGNQPYADEFLAFYHKLDGYLGKLLAAAGDDCALVVMSDHGFCPVKAEVQLSQWLVEAGWTASRPSEGGDPLAIDPSRSKAYSLIPGRVFVNLKGREPAGIVPLEEFQEVRERLARDLLSLRTTDGDPVIRKVFRREELYWPDGARGPREDMPLEELVAADSAFGRAADLVAIPFDGYDLKMGLGAGKCFVQTQLEGMHTYHDASIMARGVSLPEERFSIVDVTRRVVAACGVEVPDDMD
jgi:predicted AlkP superfamily phosphohydrolase/phosphomutase